MNPLEHYVPPTSAEINALPANVRKFVADLETNADPSGTVRELAQCKDVMRELAASNRMLRDSVDSLTQQCLHLQTELRNRG